jgi:hypothetical protein
VTFRRHLPLLVAAVALALAAFFVVLAFDVAAWRASMRDGDAGFSPSAPVESGVWEPDGAIAAGVSRRLLALGDDLSFRRGVRLFFRSRPESDARTLADSVFATRAVVVLRDVQRSESQPKSRRSQAANLVGVLALVDAFGDREAAASLLRTSVRSFREAIALDPGNDAAHANLELALKLSGERRERFEAETGSGGAGTKRTGGRRGF